MAGEDTLDGLWEMANVRFGSTIELSEMAFNDTMARTWSVFEEISHLFPEPFQRVSKFMLETVHLASISTNWGIIALFFLLLFSAVTGRWLFWLFFSLILGFVRWLATLYQLFRISISLVGFFVIQVLKMVRRVWNFLTCPREKRRLQQKLHRARSYKRWLAVAHEIDELEGKDTWKSSKDEPPQYDQQLLENTLKQLKCALADNNIEQMMFILRSIVKRNHMGIDQEGLHTHALSGTKHVLEEYLDVVCEGLRYICSSKDLSPADKIAFFRKADLALGQTALGLSGGGSLGMYHMGVCLALFEAGCFPRVITGASGGSIIAAQLACRTK